MGGWGTEAQWRVSSLQASQAETEGEVKFIRGKKDSIELQGEHFHRPVGLQR